MPKGADKPTARGAQRAAIYYFDDLMDYMALTNDAAPMLEYCPRAVEFCSLLAEDAESFERKGHYVARGKLGFSEIEVYSPHRNGAAHQVFDAIVRIDGGQVWSNDGERIGRTKSSLIRLRSSLEHVDGAWRVLNVHVDRVRVSS